MSGYSEPMTTSVWPDDISEKLEEYVNSHSGFSEDSMILFGDETSPVSNKAWRVSLGETSLKDFKEYRIPNGKFEITIENKIVQEVNPSNLDVQKEMASFIADYCKKRGHFYYVGVLCPFFDVEKMSEQNPDISHYVSSIITVPANRGIVLETRNGKRKEVRHKLPYNEQPRDWRWKQCTAKVALITES